MITKIKLITKFLTWLVITSLMQSPIGQYNHHAQIGQYMHHGLYSVYTLLLHISPSLILVFVKMYNQRLVYFPNFIKLLINWYYSTSCSPILPVIRLIINKSDSCFTIVQIIFCHSLGWLQTGWDSTQSYNHY